MGEDGEWSNEDPLKFGADPDVGADPGIFVKVNCLALVEMCSVQNKKCLYLFIHPQVMLAIDERVE